MLYAILCYNDETVTSAWSEEKDRETMDPIAFDRAIVLANTVAEAAHIRAHLDRPSENGATGSE